MPNAINFDGPKTSSAVITSATLDGAYGDAHDLADKSSAKMLKPNDNFSLKGDGYESRWGKFKNTTKTFAQASSSLSMGAATVAMFPVDVLTGRGKARPEGERKHFLDEGVAGNVSRFGAALVSGTCEVGGALVGAGGALVTLPAKASTGKSTAEWFEGGANGGAQAAGKSSAHTLGTPVGIALDLIRVPSLAVKYGAAGLGAVAGGTIGVAAGTVRAIINH